MPDSTPTDPRDLVAEANEAASDPDRQDEIRPLLDEAVHAAAGHPDDLCSCQHRRGIHDNDGCNELAECQPATDQLLVCPCEAFAPWVDVTDHVLSIERIQIVDLQPGDTIIATLAPGTSKELAAAVEYDLMGRYPDNDINVLAPGVSLHVMRPAPAPAVTVHQHIEGDPQLMGDFLRDKGWQLDRGRQLVAEAAASDQHRPRGYEAIGHTRPGTAPQYLRSKGTTGLCLARYEMPDGVWHCCDLPPGHQGPPPGSGVGHHCRCGDGWSSITDRPDPTAATP